MVTGDHPGTAEAIAYKVGILWSPTARKIEEMNAAEGALAASCGAFTLLLGLVSHTRCRGWFLFRV
jgi:magnesium-transporting ATPase (P-type)